MKRFNFRPAIYFFFVLTIVFSEVAHAAEVQPVNLQCEHLVNPIGIDAPHPRFTWQMQDGRLAASQSAYQVYVSKDSAMLNNNQTTLWASPKTTSAVNLISYQGKTAAGFYKIFLAGNYLG